MKKLLFLLFLINLIPESYGQIISIDTSKVVDISKKMKIYSKEDSLKKIYKIIPRTATIRSAMVPGWGQVYNRQIWKVPFVAGFFAVNIYFIIRNDTRYHYYRGRLGDTYINGVVSPNITFKTPLFNEVNIVREYNQDQLNNIVAGYRKNRDASYLFLFVTWAANIVDANVTAHLKTFDITDDISLKIQPSFSSPEIMEPVFGAKLTLTLK